MKTDSIYKEEIMEIYSEKPNFGKLKNKTHEATLKNPSCNDEFTIELEIDKGKINDAKFHGKGCVISTISASVLTQKIKGMNLHDVKKLTKKDLDKFIGLEIIPTRIKCELLPLEILRRVQ
ncbi:Fe-S cluster protein [Candidatus Pacearchaeota archaeon CG10_big_fil_rev_8_21_14_0_10_32_42]|nr:MAG: Fe-S cluster protein [Candidatus Pacearchaeota archaeon CG10_big_fil_rev_8_21_14_0_10_32_42]